MSVETGAALADIGFAPVMNCTESNGIEYFTKNPKIVKQNLMPKRKAEPNMGFSERLSRLWPAHFPTQRAFARALGTNDGVMSVYLNNGVVPHGDRLALISKLCGVSIDYLVRGEDNPDQRRVQDLPAAGQAVVRLMEGLSPAEQDALVEAATLLQDYHSDAAIQLMAAIELMRWSRKRGKRMGMGEPDEP